MLNLLKPKKLQNLLCAETKDVYLKPHFVTEHLNKNFQKKNVCYYLHSKRLENHTKRPEWRAINGYYALFIDRIRVLLLGLRQIEINKPTFFF